MWKMATVLAMSLAVSACAAGSVSAAEKSPVPKVAVHTGSSFSIRQYVSNQPNNGARPHVSSMCTDAVFARWLYNSFGMTLAKIWNHSHWCYSGTSITNATGWVDTYTAPGWKVSNATWTKQWLTQPYTMVTHARARFTLGVDGHFVQAFTPDVCIEQTSGGTDHSC